MAYQRFCVPREIYCGWGAVEALDRVEGKKALVVTDKGMRGPGYVDKVERILGAKGIEISVFDEVEPNPSKETVRKGFNLAQEFAPDLIVGLGGGSSMDAGKAIWAFYENPDLMQVSWTDALRELPARRLRQKARYVAIASTSGTGSEVTAAAVITNRDVHPAVKNALFSQQLTPDIAIADAEMASTMPPHVTADTGFDALVHAVECYVYIDESDTVDPLAVRAARLIFQWLPKAVANGQDVSAREKMHMASLLAGMAFANGRLGLVHGTAHQLGAEFGVAHGRANALMLNYVFAYLFPTRAGRMAQLAHELGIEATNEREAAQRLIDKLEDLKRQVGIPASIKDTGIDEKTFMVELDMLSVNARGARPDPEGRLVPAIRDMFLKAWEGAKVRLS
jgi:alcohol dehydrogenase class IV